MSYTDDELMAKATGGEAEAFDAIVRRHQALVQRFASRMFGGDVNLGADAAVGAFLRLWETRSSYVPCGKLDAWLLSTAYRLCVDQLRRRVETREVEREADCEAGAHLRLESAELASAVRDAVSRLPEEQRAVIVLSVYEGLSYESISQVLGIPAGTVASRKNHALAALRRRLSAWEEI